jgi:hypothetical protein
MTLTTEQPVGLRVGKTLMGIAVGSIYFYFLIWALLEGYKYVGR